MVKISLFFLIGLCAWLMGIMAGQGQSAPILGAEPSAIEMIYGIDCRDCQLSYLF